MWVQRSFRLHFYCVLLMVIKFLASASAEPISIIIGSGAVVAVSLTTLYLKCKVYECCTNEWVRLKANDLRIDMKRRLYGQHLAQKTIAAAIESHWNNKEPRKALVLSFHGWTGSGKNHLSSIIAENMYRKGLKSDFVISFISTLHFPNPQETAAYGEQLREWIRGNTSKCERSLFIFDEIDKMSSKIMDVLKPYLDHYDNVDGVDFRKSIFIFLSNTGGDEIAQRCLKHYEDGKSRESLSLQEMEKIIISHAYNLDGGLKSSALIESHLIDHFVPFLPLERTHIIYCIRDYLNSRGVMMNGEQIASIADSLQYFPKVNPVYSSSGCKRIAQKADLLISIEMEKETKKFSHLADEDEL